MLNTIQPLISDLGLNFNVSKSGYMIYRAKTFKSYTFDHEVTLNNIKIERVSSYKYLGVIISDNYSNELDIIRLNNSFLKQFYAIFRRFCYADQKVLLFLFKTWYFIIWCRTLDIKQWTIKN